MFPAGEGQGILRMGASGRPAGCRRDGLILVLDAAGVASRRRRRRRRLVACRPPRGSTPRAPLISGIGMSIGLQNYVQLLQGARPKPIQPIIRGGYKLFEIDGFVVQLSYMQIIIVLATVGLMAGFTLLITRTALGRAQRACEQDQKMASLLGVNVDRTISLTF